MLSYLKNNKMMIVSIIFSLAALIVSIESLSFNKAEAERRRRVNLNVGADWVKDKIFISADTGKSEMDSTVSGKLYGLLRGLVELKITNNSERTVTIDKVSIKYISQRDSNVISFAGGNTFIENDSLHNFPNIKFPVVLNSYEPLYFYAFIPIPVSAQLRELFKGLKQNQLYPSSEILKLLILHQLIESNIDKKRLPTDSLVAQANTIISLTGNLSNVPEMLIIYSDKNTVKRRGERVLEVTIRLSTGEDIVKKLDYLDIRRQDMVW